MADNRETQTGGVKDFFSKTAGASAAPFLFFSILFACLASRDFYWDDSAEFVYLAGTWGIAHPSGYPLYTVFCNLIGALQGPTAWLLSISNGLFTALFAAVLVRVLQHLGWTLKQAVFTAFFIGLGAVTVRLSLVPEVYSLHLFLQWLAVERLLQWRKTRSRGVWASFWLVFGLSFSNHLTSFWLFPAILIWLWYERKSLKSWRHWLLAGGCFLAGLLPYLYLPLRALSDPLYNQGDPSTLSALLDVIGGKAYRYRLFTLSWAEFLEQARLWGQGLWEQWSPVYLAAVLPGGVWLAGRMARRDLLALGSWLLLGCLYAWNYYIPDKDGYHLATYALVGLSVCGGFFLLYEQARKRLSFLKTGAHWPIFLAVAVLIWPLGQALRASQADNSSLRDLSVDVWRVLPPKTVLITEDINLHYATLILQREGLIEADRAVVNPYLLGFDWYRRFLARRYPDLEHPPEWESLGVAFREAGEQLDGEALGSKRQDLVEEMTRELMRTLARKRPMAYYRLDAGDESGTAFGFRLQNAGVVSKVVFDEEEREPVSACEFSPKYLAGKERFRDAREKSLIGRYATACNRQAIEWVEAGRPEEALPALRRALRYDPEYYPAMKNLGLVLVKHLGKKTEGIEVWKRYVEKAGDDADSAVRRWLRENAH